MSIKIDEIKVEIKLSDKPNLKARAVVNFGEFTVKGFRLSVSEHESNNLDQEKLWLQPPSYLAGRKWQPVFFIENKDVWRALERKVYEEYKKCKLEKDKDFDIPWEEIGKDTI